MTEEKQKTDTTASLDRIEVLAERLDDHGPIYAPVRGHASNPMLANDGAGGFMLVMENIDVGGGESVLVEDDFALAWAAQFGGTGETP